MSLEHFELPFEPLPASRSVVIAPYARFTMLTSRLVRMEYSPTNQFEDTEGKRPYYTNKFFKIQFNSRMPHVNIA